MKASIVLSKLVSAQGQCDFGDVRREMDLLSMRDGISGFAFLWPDQVMLQYLEYEGHALQSMLHCLGDEIWHEYITLLVDDSLIRRRFTAWRSLARAELPSAFRKVLSEDLLRYYLNRRAIVKGASLRLSEAEIDQIERIAARPKISAAAGAIEVIGRVREDIPECVYY